MAVEQNQESILRTVRALYSRASHKNTTEHEAALALSRAEHMMVKHSLTEAMIGDLEADKIKPVKEVVNIDGAYKADRSVLLVAIAKTFNCRVISMMRYEPVPNSDRLRHLKEYQIVGFKSDIDVTLVLMELIDGQLMEEIGKPGLSVLDKKEFIAGFISRVSLRLHQTYVEEVEKAKPGTALVLAQREEKVYNYFTELFPRTYVRRAPKRMTDGAYRSGNAAGANARIAV